MGVQKLHGCRQFPSGSPWRVRRNLRAERDMHDERGDRASYPAVKNACLVRLPAHAQQVLIGRSRRRSPSVARFLWRIVADQRVGAPVQFAVPERGGGGSRVRGGAVPTERLCVPMQRVSDQRGAGQRALQWGGYVSAPITSRLQDTSGEEEPEFCSKSISFVATALGSSVQLDVEACKLRPDIMQCMVLASF